MVAVYNRFLFQVIGCEDKPVATTEVRKIPKGSPFNPFFQTIANNYINIKKIISNSAFSCKKGISKAYEGVGEGFVIKCTGENAYLFRCPQNTMLDPKTMSCITNNLSNQVVFWFS